ncbi:MAG: DUF3488 and transglutaminase-like domain-containing protein [Gammaproteobacteria bacterium]|nr:DUF3488 and transglutaminase-like domain-containing protein [Gammaproteobacteria bacterium]
MDSLTQRFQQANPAVLWLLSGIVFILAPHVYYQSHLLVLFIGCLLFWRLGVELQYIRQPPAWFATLLAISTFIGITYGYQTVFGRDAGVALLITMLCLKLMEMGAPRDFLVAVFLGYFVVITGFLFSQSVIIGLLMTTAVFLLTTSLVSYHRSERKLNSQYKSARLGINLLFQAIPLAILLFFLFPRVPGPLWGLPEQGSSASTGLSSSMAPGQITELAFDNSVAFRVEFENKIPEASQLYWRGPVFTYYDGFMWQELASNSRKFFGSEWVTELPPVPQVKMSEGIKYSVMLEPHNANWLLALDLPTLYPATGYLTQNYELLSDEPVKKLTRYEVTSHLNYKLSPEAPPANRVYRQIPQFVGPKARQLVLELQTKIQADQPYDRQIVDLILNHFRTEPFFYTRTPPAMLDNPIDQFLFEERRGFCEHYASAFVVLMRAAGLPARIVTGYLGGELNTIGNYFIVRQSDAHAWAEVWLENQGWIRVDPTAVIPPGRIEQAQFRDRFRRSAGEGVGSQLWFADSIKRLKFIWDNVNHSWNDWIVGYNPTKQQSFLDALGIKDFSWSSLIFILFGGLALLVLVIAWHLSGHTIRKPNQAHVIFRRFCRKLARKGFRYSPSETAHNFAQRVAEKRSDIAKQVEEIAELYNQVRYARAPAQQSLRVLEQRVRQFRP